MSVAIYSEHDIFHGCVIVLDGKAQPDAGKGGWRLPKRDREVLDLVAARVNEQATRA